MMGLRYKPFRSEHCNTTVSDQNDETYGFMQWGKKCSITMLDVSQQRHEEPEICFHMPRPHSHFLNKKIIIKITGATKDWKSLEMQKKQHLVEHHTTN